MIGASELTAIEAIARTTRADFEQGKITDEEIIAGALIFRNSNLGNGSWLYDKQERAALVAAGELREIAPHMYAPVPIFDSFQNFPKGFCNSASPVLAKRIREADVIDPAVIEVIIGGCSEDKHAVDPTRYYYNQHTFVGIGQTAIAWDTIVDITGDQFEGEQIPSIYIGELRQPWTREPITDLDVC